MFATLVGTDTNSARHKSVFERLCVLAAARGFQAGNAALYVRPDETPLENWHLDMRGPLRENPDFLLAVTAPRVPGILSIPIQKIVSGPLFAVIVMNDFFGVWTEGGFFEFKEAKDVTLSRPSLPTKSFSV